MVSVKANVIVVVVVVFRATSVPQFTLRIVGTIPRLSGWRDFAVKLDTTQVPIACRLGLGVRC